MSIIGKVAGPVIGWFWSSIVFVMVVAAVIYWSTNKNGGDGLAAALQWADDAGRAANAAIQVAGKFIGWIFEGIGSLI